MHAQNHWSPCIRYAALVFLWLVVMGNGRGLSADEFTQPDPQLLPNLFAWSDTSNVWILRDGDAALLIGLGDGSVLDRLPALGIRQVEWVLFTDHHRETCQCALLIQRA